LNILISAGKNFYTECNFNRAAWRSQ